MRRRAQAAPRITPDSMELAYVDHGYAGERAQHGATPHGIELEVVKHSGHHYDAGIRNILMSVSDYGQSHGGRPVLYCLAKSDDDRLERPAVEGASAGRRDDVQISHEDAGTEVGCAGIRLDAH